MGIGRGSGENKAVQAAQQAVSSPLLETTIGGATGILINITGGEDLTILEVNQAAEIIAEAADPDAEIIFGTAVNPDLKEQILITVIATGFNREREQERVSIRRQGVVQQAQQPPRQESLKMVGMTQPQEEDLDIPSFLRKKR